MTQNEAQTGYIDDEYTSDLYMTKMHITNTNRHTQRIRPAKSKVIPDQSYAYPDEKEKTPEQLEQ